MSRLHWTKWEFDAWINDQGVRASSLAARGLWMDMLSIAARHDPPGYVGINGNPLDSDTLARMVGASVQVVETLLAELERNGVFSRNRNGMIYSRRMVRDIKRIKNSRENGKKGGNPSIGNKRGISGWVNPPVNPPLNPTPRALESQEFKESQEIDKSSTAENAARVEKPTRQPQAPPGLAALRSKSELDRIEAACRKAAGLEGDPSPGLLVIGPIVELIAEGHDLDRDVLPVMRAKAAAGHRARSWGYFVQAVRDARLKPASQAPPSQGTKQATVTAGTLRVLADLDKLNGGQPAQKQEAA